MYILKYNYMSSAVLLYTKYTAITFSHSYDYYYIFQLPIIIIAACIYKGIQLHRNSHSVHVCYVNCTVL